MPEPEKAALSPEIPDLKILDHASPHVINSAQLPVVEASFAFAVDLMRLNDDDLNNGLIPPDINSDLQKTKIQPAAFVPGLPVFEDVKDINPHIQRFPCSAYFVSKESEQNIRYSNQAARNFADADQAAPGKPLLALVELVATEYLSFPSLSRVPGRDFLSLQRMLGRLQKAGYNIPDVTLKLARKRDGQMRYQEITIDAKHLWSTVKTLLGTRCLLIPSKTSLDEVRYQESLQSDTVISPLPSKLLEWAQARVQLQQKALQLRQEAARVNVSVKPEAEARRLPFSLETLSQAEMESLTVREFLQAIERTKNLKKLMLADNLAEEAITATQRQIKKELKKAPHKINAKGKVNLRTVVQAYEHTTSDETSYYGRFQANYVDAETGKDTSKQISQLTEEEIAEVRNQKRRNQSHQQGTSTAK